MVTKVHGQGTARQETVIDGPWGWTTATAQGGQLILLPTWPRSPFRLLGPENAPRPPRTMIPCRVGCWGVLGENEGSSTNPWSPQVPRVAVLDIPRASVLSIHIAPALSWMAHPETAGTWPSYSQRDGIAGSKSSPSENPFSQEPVLRVLSPSRKTPTASDGPLSDALAITRPLVPMRAHLRSHRPAH